MTSERIVSVIGLGYVGLPVAAAFARSGLSVVGFDVDRQRIDELTSGIDRTREVPSAQVIQDRLIYTSDPDVLQRADFRSEYGLTLQSIESMEPADAVVLAVGHDAYGRRSWGLLDGLLKDGQGIVADLTGFLDRAGEPEGVELWRL